MEFGLYRFSDSEDCYILVVLFIFMAALCNRAGHYTFALWFLSSSFFLRLISAVGDWMSTILPHMM